MVVEITLKDTQEAVRLNQLASNYEGKLTVDCGSTIVDAKSLLALLTLVGRDKINLVAPDHEQPRKFLDFLKKLW